jgi:prolyl-tRNA synthetase
MKLMMKVKWIRDNRFTALLAISIKTDKILFVKHYTNFKQNGYRVSELFQPINTVPHAVDTPKNNITNTQKDLSKSSKLLVDNGLVKCAYPGNYVFLPLGMRVLEKLTKLVDDCMRHVGGQKMLLPTLTQADLWKKTGRYEKMKDELLLTKDRHNRTLVFRYDNDLANISNIGRVY